MSNQLIRGTEELVHELVRRLQAGESFDNLKLKRLADKFFGGIRAKGTYTSRDCFDALETAVNKLLLETMAAKPALPVPATLKELRELLSRLPVQTSRLSHTPPISGSVQNSLTQPSPRFRYLELGPKERKLWLHKLSLPRCRY